VRGYVVDIYFCVFDVSVEEFDSLSASSLNTTTNNKSNSIGLNAGGNANTNSAKLNRVSLDYTNNKHNSKSWHLGYWW
jgi:hypothetical protein